MLLIVATNFVASQPPKRQQTGMPTARAKMSKLFIFLHDFLEIQRSSHRSKQAFCMSGHEEYIQLFSHFITKLRSARLSLTPSLIYSELYYCSSQCSLALEVLYTGDKSDKPCGILPTQVLSHKRKVPILPWTHSASTKT